MLLHLPLWDVCAHQNRRHAGGGHPRVEELPRGEGRHGRRASCPVELGQVERLVVMSCLRVSKPQVA